MIDGDSSADAIFQIRRVGQTIFEEYDTGSGMQTLHFATHANLADPVTFSLFLLQGPDESLTHQGSFDNLTVTADRFLNFVPEPSSLFLATIAMALIGAGRLKWSPRRRKPQ